MKFLKNKLGENVGLVWEGNKKRALFTLMAMAALILILFIINRYFYPLENVLKHIIDILSHVKKG